MVLIESPVMRRDEWIWAFGEKASMDLRWIYCSAEGIAPDVRG